MYFVFFFNATAPPEIYTYGHPLSLHDALPISTVQQPCRHLFARPRRARNQHPAAGCRHALERCPHRIDQARIAGEFLAAAVALAQRSEEHTSELQSLMRISYAVFCLKKKNILTDT